ncbi:hypothetical protein BJY24_006955 [Nocardia transvalensis]|uniref:Uncharacterized protein n=1 Tax=Nocardia transvalensis TaxID=37333 RepID=A0A7W9PLU3_9NOCA|nr:hypothetical protein [Nocardia transvalensis]MBB5918043.1 hypothetical protein [Nocardia transvalensis]
MFSEAPDPTQVTEADLRQLLQTGCPGTRLVLREGRIRLAPATGDDADGKSLITRGELASRVGDRLESSTLMAEAELLNQTFGFH